MRISGSRKGIATVITTLKIITVVAVLGIVALSFYNGQTMTFKQLASSTFSTISSKVQESLVLENAVYHSSTQQFNFTFTNTGYIPVNITSININTNATSSFNVLATTSGSSPVSLTSVLNSLSSTSESFTVPGTVILPGQAYTTIVPYHCFCDPATVTVTTSRGTVLKSNLIPNVGWYNNHEQFRKRITVNYNQVVGNPGPIILDNTQSVSGATSSNQITLSSFTVNSGTNRLLLVAIQSSTGSVNGITYSGQTLTKANATSSTVDSELWYLTNPPAGSSNVIVTMSTTSNVIVGAYSFFGVDQTTPIGEGNKNQAVSGSSVSTSFSSTYSNSWVVDSVAVASSTNITPNGGQTSKWTSSIGTTTGGSSYRVISNPSLTTMRWSF